MEITLDLFLTGSVPKEMEDELHLIIEQKASDTIDSTQKTVQKIDTSYNQIQENKKKQDLR